MRLIADHQRQTWSLTVWFNRRRRVNLNYKKSCLMLKNKISAGNMSLVFLVPNRDRGARNLCSWYLTLSALAVAVVGANIIWHDK